MRDVVSFILVVMALTFFGISVVYLSERFIDKYISALPITIGAAHK